MEADIKKLLAKYANSTSNGYRVGSTITQWGEDPRATVILIACDVERALSELLSAFLCYLNGVEPSKSQQDKLIGGAWNPFSRLNRIVTNLKLITKSESNDLEHLVNVRNSYAHKTDSALSNEKTQREINEQIRKCKLHKEFEEIASKADAPDKNLVVMDMIADELIRRFRCREQRFRSKPGKGYSELSVSPDHDEW